MSVQTYYFGGDVSKGYCDFIVLDQNEDCVEENFQLDDTAQGHRKLSEIIKKFLHPNAKIYVGFESTGGYENNWFHLILKLTEKFKTENLFVTRLNPKAVYNHKKALLKRITTDKESARVIAHYLIAHKKKIIYQSSPRIGQQNLEEAQNLLKFIESLKKQNTQCRNRLQSLLYKAHPQLIEHCRDGVSDWILKLIIQYPGSEELAGASVEDVSSIKFISTSKARQLINSAKTSVASLNSQTVNSTISALATHILSLDTLIEHYTNILSRTPAIQSFEQEIESLVSLKGIGDYSAYGIMLQIVSVERFPTTKAICAFFGLHPTYIDSGDKKGQSEMSKNGSSDMRRILYWITQTAVQKEPRLKELYKKYVEKKGSKMEAIGIMMHKILRIIYGMLKHKKEYDPMIDEKNQKNSRKNKKNKKIIDQNRRFQTHDGGAPVSRRQSKKRAMLSEEEGDNHEEKNTEIHYYSGAIKISKEKSNAFWKISSYST